LLALSTVIFLAFVIFALILLRILLKLYFERLQEQLGSRFKNQDGGGLPSASRWSRSFSYSFLPMVLLNRTIE